MCRSSLFFVLVLTPLHHPLAAQGVMPDTVIRLRVRQTGVKQPVIGRLTRLDPDTLYLQSADGDLAIARSEVARIEVSRGMHSNAARGFTIGLVAGGAVGLATGMAFVADPDGCWCDPNAGTVAGVVAIIALPVAALGAGIGALSRSERWKPASAGGRTLSLYLAPKQDRTTVGLAMRF